MSCFKAYDDIRSRVEVGDLVGLLAEMMLRRHPGSKIIHDSRLTRTPGIRSWLRAAFQSSRRLDTPSSRSGCARKMRSMVAR
jgi:hypothetical protein